MRASSLPHGDFQPQGSSYRSFCWGSLELHIHPDATAVVRALAPDEPVICNRPHAAARAARFFAENFPGKSMYAVKADRKSTRLNSSHVKISYAVFCLKKKNKH